MTNSVTVGLTAKQRECLDFIRSYWLDNGVSPSFREIMAGLGLQSTSGVHRLVSALIERGHVYTMYGQARCLIPRDLAYVETADEDQAEAKLIAVDFETMALVTAAARSIGVSTSRYVNAALERALRSHFNGQVSR